MTPAFVALMSILTVPAASADEGENLDQSIGVEFQTLGMSMRECIYETFGNMSWIIWEVSARAAPFIEDNQGNRDYPVGWAYYTSYTLDNALGNVC
jgi:hypothetical protein